jgi:hypothetical protein
MLDVILALLGRNGAMTTIELPGELAERLRAVAQARGEDL